MKFFLYDESRNLIDSAEVKHDLPLEIGDVLNGVHEAPQSSRVEVVLILLHTKDEQHVVVV